MAHVLLSRSLNAARWTGLALLLVLLPAGVAPAAEPSALYRHIGRDVGLCLEAADLARAWPEMRDSRWFARVQASPVADQWRTSGEFQQFDQARQAVEQIVEQPLGELLTDLLGQQALIAVSPGAGKPTVLLVTRARTAASLNSILERWDRLEPAQKVMKQTPQGQAYAVRMPERPGLVLSFAVRDDVLIASPDEASVIRALHREDSLANDPQFQSGYQSLRDSSVIRLYVRLRAWDETFQIADGLASDDRGRRMVAQIWSACHSVSIGLEPRDGLIVDAHLHYDRQASPAWQQFVSETQGPARFLKRVPSTALLALGGRFRWTWLDAAIRDITPASKLPEWEQFLRAAQGLCLGHDPVLSVSARLTPETSAAILPGSSAAPEWAPLDAVIAVNLEADPSETEPTLARGLHNALRTGLNVWAAVRNAEGEQYQAVVRHRDGMDRGITWLEGLRAWQPAFATTAEFLVLGTSPQSIEQTLQQDADQSLSTDPALRGWLDRECPAAGQLLVVNIDRIRDWLNRHGVAMVRHLGSALPEEQARRRLTRLDELLQPLSQLIVAAQLEPDQIRLLLSIRVTAD